jgi:hypothetical protein
MDKLYKGEPHPVVWDTVNFIRDVPDSVMENLKNIFLAAAEDGNRICSISLSTLTKLNEGVNISDRDVIALAWAIKKFLETGKIMYYPKGKWKDGDDLEDILGD